MRTSASAATTAILPSLPFGKAALCLFAVISILSVATSYDSASYTDTTPVAFL
jgi:choline-glycine betaine transporter